MASVRKPTFFLPVKVLSRRFRTLLCASLGETWRSGALKLPHAIPVLSVVARSSIREWVVYAKAPFGEPAQVLTYLANYTHRIAISNSRLIAFDRDSITFRYRDYRAENAQKIMTLEADEFLRRFLMHVVPARFVRIRYYGFMANRTRARTLALPREFIGDRTVPLPPPSAEPEEHLCPACGEGTMRSIAFVEPQCTSPAYENSS